MFLLLVNRLSINFLNFLLWNLTSKLEMLPFYALISKMTKPFITFSMELKMHVHTENVKK